VIATIASQQILALRRQRVFVSLLALMLAMTATAGVLGWSSHRTIVGVYDQATILLAQRGEPAPANPFTLKPTLSLLSNMEIYIPLIGALLAIVLGHLSLADDEASGVGRLVFSRPIDRRAYLAGKVAAAAIVLATLMAAGVVVSTASLWIVNSAVPTGTQLARIVAFYGLSWLYLMVFAAIGMLTMLLAGRRPLALLSAMGAWLVITFVVPQLTSGLRPVASLNPIVDPVSTSQTFFRISRHARPVSIVEQYKTISAQLLEIAPAEPAGHTLARLATLAVALAAVAVAAAFAIVRHDFSKGASHD
jgi:ABC-type transport system involved in multi-copper enzyme maturation permease subunit